MQRIHQFTALVFLALSGLMMWESWELEYYTPIGPGSGFFPFWLGAVFGGLSLVWLIQISRKSGKPEERPFLPDLKGCIQILSLVGSLVLVSLLMNLLGYPLSMFLFFLFLLLYLGKQRVWASLIISLVGSVGVYYVFVKYLDVQLPLSSLTLLNKVGL